MKPEEIIYYDEYSGDTEFCFKVDVDRHHWIETKFGTFDASMVAKKLYMDGTYDFLDYQTKVDTDNFFSGGYQKNEMIIKECVSFSLIEKNSFYLIIEASRTTPSGRYSFAMLEVSKQKRIKINGLSGNGLIKIYNVDNFKYDEEMYGLLGHMALAMGLYFLVDLGGNWESLDNDGNFVEIVVNEQTKEIKNAIDDSVNNVADIIKRGNDEIRAGQNLLMESQNDIAAGLGAQIDVVNAKLNLIDEKIDGIAAAMKVYREAANRMLQKAVNEEERELTREHFCDIVVDRVTEAVNRREAIVEYEREEKSLRLNFGKNWGKLNEQSKQFLLTAKVMFSQMVSIDRELDYSGVCLLVTKALELELKDRFYFEFRDYLSEVYPNNLERWPYALCTEKYIGSSKYCYPLEERNCTLGTIPYICCTLKSGKVSKGKYEISKQTLYDFVKTKFVEDYSKEEALSILFNMGDDINRIKELYRNPAAHTGNMTKVSAEKCFNEVTDVEKILVRILDYFKV